MSVAAAGARPNIIVLFADDLGYGELSCQGNPEIPTPHIDSIANNGVRFTDGYVAGPNCSPSRAGLLSHPLSMMTVRWSGGQPPGTDPAPVNRESSNIHTSGILLLAASEVYKLDV
jgi:arylsulfatase A-like enzyme